MRKHEAVRSSCCISLPHFRRHREVTSLEFEQIAAHAASIESEALEFKVMSGRHLETAIAVQRVTIRVRGRKAMTKLLQQAFERAAELPQEDQDKFARFLLAELESDRQWAELFSRPESEDLLERLADEAVAAHRAGLTRPLNPEEL